MYRFRSASPFALSACLMLCAAACSGDSNNNDSDTGSPDAGTDAGGDIGTDGGGDGGTGNPFVIEPGEAPLAELSFASTTGCVLDIDCADTLYCFQGACTFECGADDECGDGESCTDRGRCIDGSQKDLDGSESAAVPDVWPGVGIEELPPLEQQVLPGQDEIVITITTTNDNHNGSLLYRTELSDSGTPETSRLRRASGERDFQIRVPTGRASLEGDEAGLESVYVVTSVGAFSLNLIPKLPFSGTYACDVTIPEFGQFGLPLDMQIVLSPEDATLEEAESAYVVLPVAQTRIFTPIEATEDGPEFVSSELLYDDFAQRWFATFENEYRLPDAALLGGYPSGQIERSLRIEIEPLDDQSLIGRISDRWVGFYDERSSDGVSDIAVNAFEGEIYGIRRGPAVSHSAAATFDIGDLTGNPAMQPLPPVDACEDGMFAIDDIDVEGTTSTCAAITTIAEFELADPADQALCSLAVAATALNGETTASQITAFLDDEIDDPGGLSFAEFMANCASDDDETCVPTPEVLCGRQLVAHAYANQQVELGSAALLVETYTKITREAYLGRQLGAFQTDSDMRLTWLETTDYPAIVTSAVQDLNERLLQEWSDNVLDVHLTVLSGQFDASGLSVLSRTPTGEEAQAARQQLLLEMSQSWRASMDALTLAASRWHTLYQGDADRAQATDFVSTRMLDLYVLSSVLSDLNRAAGAGFANAGFGSGFSSLMRELSRLSLPFDELIYARDGEVVVTRSLDPNSTNDDVLDELEAEALSELADAAESVSTIIAEAQAQALQQEQIRNRINNDIENLQDELVRACGLPAGCSRNDLDDPTCAVPVFAGTCGFVVARGTSDVTDFQSGAQNISEAGRALLSVQEAGINYNIALEEQRNHNTRATMYLETADAFGLQVLDWNERRQAVDNVVGDLVAQGELAQQASLDDFRANLAEQDAIRTTAYESTAASIRDWNTIRLDGVDADMRDLVAVTALNQTAGGLRDTAESIDTIAAIVADGMPKSVGTSSDVSAPLRLATRMSAYGITSGVRLVATGLDAVAAGVENAATRRELLREATLTNLELESDLETLGYENQVADLEGRLELIALENEVAAAELENLIDNLEGALELELAFERDLVELRDRQNRAWELINQAVEYELRTAQAELTIQQRLNEYLQIVQNAQLISARLDDLNQQRTNVNQLLGSPSVVFAWANRLIQAESRLARAKDRMMDWVVALEYYAVRPFMDQRLQILLARNTYQLEDVAEELRRLQRSCGGAVNTETAELSIRDDLLGLGFTTLDSQQERFGAADRFIATLERATIPIDKRVRYTTDSSVGDLVRRDDVLAATFQFSLVDFANLGATCNAKIASLAVELVGEGLGDARPTVTLLYDGTSQLRSCQPGIDAYVENFGPEATVFGSITSFRTAGRSVSPVAGVGQFGSSNSTLAGLPLASQYTVLIDPAIGENANIDWDALEDIRLAVEYTYQDPFPAGQCE